MIKPSISTQKLDPYKVSKSARMTPEEKSRVLKLDWNETTFPPSPLVKKALKKAVDKNFLYFYSDVTSYNLRKKLTKYTRCGIKSIQVFNGSDAALRDICMAFLNPKDKVVIREPTYAQFRVFSDGVGAKYIKFLAANPFDLGLEKFKKNLDLGVKMVYLANPNNPTGVLYPKFLIKMLLENYPKTLFVIDEAYYEFAQKTVSSLVKKHKNIIITRTFSKAFGLAGLRIGYVLACPEIIKILNKIRNGKEVNLLGQIAASAALDDLKYMNGFVNEVLETKDWLVEELMSRDIEVYNSPANFILIKHKNINQLIDFFEKKKIMIRDRSYLPQLRSFARVTVGLRDQMNIFLKKFDQFLKHNS